MSDSYVLRVFCFKFKRYFDGETAISGYPVKSEGISINQIIHTKV